MIISILFFLISLLPFNASGFGLLNQMDAGSVAESGGGTLLVGDATEYTGANHTISSDIMYIFKYHGSGYIAAASGNAVAGYIYMHDNDAGAIFKMCIYLDTDGDGCSDGNCDLQGCSDEKVGHTTGLNSVTFSTPVAITSGSEYLPAIVQKSGTSLNIESNGGSQAWQYNTTGSYAAPVDPWTYSGQLANYGSVTIYVTD